MLMPEKTIEDYSIFAKEIPVKELTYHRLTKQYEFIASSLPGLAKDLGRPLTMLDVGTWRGDYIHYFTDLPSEVVGNITAIDISEKKVRQSLQQPALQPHLESGRLRIMVGDGTNMQEFPNESFGYINNIEIFVGLKGRVPDLASEVYRTLTVGGRTSINLRDQRNAYAFGEMGEFSPRKKVKYSKEEFEEIIRDHFKGDTRKAWFGQMPISEDEEDHTRFPYKKGNKRDHIILAQNALSVRSVYNAEGNKQFDPCFWLLMVRKW